MGGVITVNMVILAMIFRGFTPLEIYDRVKMMDAYSTYTIAFRVYYVLGILSGVLIAFIAVVLQERMKSSAPQLMRLAVIGASGYDERRIYLMGHSMGGAGTLHLGVKYASIWAALAPIAPAAFGLNPDSLAEIKSMPVIFVHGDADEMVPVAISRRWVDKLKN